MIIITKQNKTKKPDYLPICKGIERNSLRLILEMVAWNMWEKDDTTSQKSCQKQQETTFLSSLRTQPLNPEQFCAALACQWCQRGPKGNLGVVVRFHGWHWTTLLCSLLLPRHRIIPVSRAATLVHSFTLILFPYCLFGSNNNFLTMITRLDPFVVLLGTW